MLTEGVDYGGTICGIVIMAVSIVIQVDLQRPYDLLDIVVVRQKWPSFTYLANLGICVRA